MQDAVTLTGGPHRRSATLARTGSAPVRLPLQLITRMFLVCAGYYVGTQIGFILRLPPTTPSVMWPPNAILTATLLLSTPRRWGLFLLAALPAHLLAMQGGTWPTSMVLALFLTNCSEALIGAIAVRSLSGASVRFDTLRATAAFLAGAVVLGPFLSSFLDAAVVTALIGERYWEVWTIRFPSNVLTELALVPAIITVARHRTGWVRAATRRRRWEAALLVLALVTVAAFVFTASVERDGPAWVGPGTPLPLLLPLLLWAAVRFGPGGVSLALLTTALVAIWAATHGLGVFALPPEGGVLALQVFLTATATPLLCLAALIEERRRAEEALQARLRFEEMLSRLSGAFVQPPSHEMPEAFRTWVRRLAEFLDLDGVSLLEPAPPDRDDFVAAYSWAVPGWSVPAAGLPASDYPWATGSLRQGLACEVPHPDARADVAARDRVRFETASVRAALLLPLLAGGRVIGALALWSRRERAWPRDLLPQFRVVTEVLANALARRQSEDALRATETINSAILSSLTSHVAVLDRRGQVVAVNDSWALALQQHSASGRAPVCADYLDLCRNANQPDGPEDLASIHRVLDGSLPAFAAERVVHTAQGERWYAVSVVPLNRPEGGAVVSHTEITERRRAEAEAHHSREELAHFLRVSTMGEMTTSLAHELNQPLTAILANAQAARHLLSTARPDLDEVREILADMIEEDKRAGEVIRRLRELLKKGQREAVLLDLNMLVRGVAHIVSSDALIRNVAVQLDLHGEPLTVTADRVQIQQVLLNLVLNAMEAMVDSGRDRRLVLRSRRTAGGTAQVDVQDSGKGIQENLQELVFQPFFTTKPNGMGMGLSIARSIAEAHGGTIRAANNPGGGATFHLTLPRAAAS